MANSLSYRANYMYYMVFVVEDTWGPNRAAAPYSFKQVGKLSFCPMK